MNVTPESKPEAILQQEQPNTTQNENISIAANNVDTTKGSAESTVPEDPNWKAFREGRKQDRAAKDAAEKKAAEKEAEVAALKAAMEAAFSKSTPQFQPQNEQYPQEETEDERIDKKVKLAIAAKEAEYEKQRQEHERQTYPQRLAATYTDFYQTISEENMDYLDYHYPEVSNPLKRSQDGFDKWSDIYKAIKKFVPNAPSAKKDSLRADANHAKPRSMSMPSITQPGEARSSSILSDERKAANWERMQKTLKGLSS